MDIHPLMAALTFELASETTLTNVKFTNYESEALTIDALA